MKMSDTTFRQKRTLKFPYIYIRVLNDDIAYLISSMPKGELPVVTTVEGKLRSFASITRDPIHLQLFIQQYNPMLVISKENRKQLNDISDYIMEVDKLWEN